MVEPGKVIIPEKFKTVAVKYNNINVAPNPFLEKGSFLGKEISDDQNLDSIASEVYFGYFVDELRKQDFFDTILEIEAENYSRINVLDTNYYRFSSNYDSILSDDMLRQKLNVFQFSKAIHEYPNYDKPDSEDKYLHPQFALYQANELKQIKQETNADLLISLDYYSSLDAVRYSRETTVANEVVLNHGYWNFYDLNHQTFHSSYNKRDTVYWTEYTSYQQQVKGLMPPRKDAILNAADIAGTKFAQYLVPHWIEVQRMYYSSGHIELKKTDEMIKKGEWLEAAKIWKEQTHNNNQSIEAKSKFNMGLVCEMQGNLDAALEWVVESFHVFGQENEQHYKNCMDYIHILSTRKRDIKLIETQYSFKQ